MTQIKGNINTRKGLNEQYLNNITPFIDFSIKASGGKVTVHNPMLGQQYTLKVQ